MTDVRRVGDLEVGQDFRFLRQEWLVERAGWTVMALLIVAALLGLCGGPGPLSNASASLEDGSLQIEYDRFGHLEAHMRLHGYLAAGTAAPDGTVSVWINQAYAKRIQISQVIPEPEKMLAGPDRLIFVFRVADPTQPTLVTFFLQPRAIGPVSGRIGLPNRPPLDFSQFIYP
jgi:hypothetical protein